MNRLSFTKMQGLGNDFVVINTLQQSFLPTKEKIRRLADRRLGVGCDQVLLLTPSVNSIADFGYRIFNADGSEAAHCGNGARCIGLYIQQERLSQKTTIVLQTMHDVLSVQELKDGLFCVEMGEPAIQSLQTLIVWKEKSIVVYPVVLSNPHAVILESVPDEAEMVKIGAALNSHAYFVGGVNVEFMQCDENQTIQLRVYERGVGLTPACGSGACAAVAVGRHVGLLNAHVTVKQPGGDCQVSWRGMGNPIYLTGPAMRVFDGVITI